MTFMVYNNVGNDERVRRINSFLETAMLSIQAARSEMLMMVMQDIAVNDMSQCPVRNQLRDAREAIYAVTQQLAGTFVVTPYCAPPSNACLRYCDLTERPTLEAYKLCTGENR